MGKDNTAKTILIVGGVGLGVYLLANSQIRQQLEDAISKLTGNFPGGGGGGGGIGDITLPGFDLPSFTMPGLDLSNLLGGLDTSAGLGGLGDLLGDLGDLFKPQPAQASNQPTEHATLLDVVYSMPSWGKGAIGVSAGLLGGYGGYQVIKLTSPILKQIGVQTARAIGGSGSILAKLLGETGSKAASKLVPTAAGKVAVKIMPKAAALVSTKIAGKGLTRFIPYVGWGLLAADIVADLTRILFPIAERQTGIDLPEPPSWLGIIPIIDFFRGTPLLAAEPAAGGSPATVAPTGGGYYGGGGGEGGRLSSSWCEGWGSPPPAEIKAAESKPKVATTASTATKTAFPAFTTEQKQTLIKTLEKSVPAGLPAGAKVAQIERYAAAMRNLGY